MGLLAFLLLTTLWWRSAGRSERLLPIGPYAYARMIFKPSWGGEGQGRYTLDELVVLHTVRSVVGLLIMAGVLFTYDGFKMSLLGQAAGKFGFTVLLMAPLSIAVMIALVIIADDGRRQITKDLASGPVLALGMASLLMLGLWGFSKGGNDWAENLADGYGPGFWGGLNKAALGVVDTMQWAWIIPFLLCCLWFCYIHMFRASDGHPFLAALMGPCFAIAAAVFDLSGIGGENGIPISVGMAVSLGGIAAMTGLAVLEFKWLRNDGYSLRRPCLS